MKFFSSKNINLNILQNSQNCFLLKYSIRKSMTLLLNLAKENSKIKILKNLKIKYSRRKSMTLLLNLVKENSTNYCSFINYIKIKYNI